MYILESSVLREERRLGMKVSIFWDIRLCSLFEVNRRFGGTCCIHPEGLGVARRVIAS